MHVNIKDTSYQLLTPNQSHCEQRINDLADDSIARSRPLSLVTDTEGTMFKKFTVEENVSTSSKVKSSQQRTIRAKILEQYPSIEPYLEEILPKKAPMVVAKWCVSL